MTHTLHRRGEDIEGDYVVLVMTERGMNTEGAKEKLQSICDILAEEDPVNMGNMVDSGGGCFARGCSVDELRSGLEDFAILHGVYTDKKPVERIIDKLEEEDFGISVVISGLFEEVFSLLNSSESEDPPFPHTINVSLGEHGDLSRLPKEEVLEISIMCGHGLVSHELVNDKVKKINEGKITSDKAAADLAEHCVCGVFNEERAKKLLEKMTE